MHEAWKARNANASLFQQSDFKLDTAKNPVSYKKILHNKLADPKQAAEYLTACYDEGPEVFLLGLRDVVEARGGVGLRGGIEQIESARVCIASFPAKAIPRACPALDSVPTALGLKVTFLRCVIWQQKRIFSQLVDHQTSYSSFIFLRGWTVYVHPPCLNQLRFLMMNTIENRESSGKTGGHRVHVCILYLASRILHLPRPLNTIEHKLFTCTRYNVLQLSKLRAFAPLRDLFFVRRVFSTNLKTDTIKHKKARLPCAPLPLLSSHLPSSILFPGGGECQLFGWSIFYSPKTVQKWFFAFRPRPKLRLEVALLSAILFATRNTDYIS